MTRRTPEQYDWGTLEFDETLLDLHYTPHGFRTIKFTVIHHMTVVDRDGNGPDTLDACFNIWQDREASAHYGVDHDKVRQYVYDSDIAWATANANGNNHGISIEHANSTGAPDWRVDPETMETGAKLVAHLHKFYRLGRPEIGVNVFRHMDFFATGCPGPFLGGSQYHNYVNRAAQIYDEITGAKPAGPVPLPTPKVRPSQDEIVNMVIRGQYGNGEERFQRLEREGWDPLEIQRIVNERLS